MNSKISQCCRSLKRSGIDGLLISNPVNISYLTGFRDADGYLFITPDEQVTYFTNPLFSQEAQALPCQVKISRADIFGLVSGHIHTAGCAKVGFESKHLPFLEYERIRDNLLRHAVDFVKTSDIVERLRSIKDSAEIGRIKKAISISLQAFEYASGIHDQAMTEKTLCLEIEKFMKSKGDVGVAFDTIVASGEKSALPHCLPGESKLDKNFFLIDLGAKHYGYCADLTRVFFWGKIPRLFTRMREIVQRAQDAAIASMHAGQRICDLDKKARSVFEKKGVAKYFVHGLGHGVGMSVHEIPYLNSRNTDILEEGMVLAIEPALYFPGKFGIRIEDMVLVKSHSVEILSR